MRSFTLAPMSSWPGSQTSAAIRGSAAAPRGARCPANDRPNSASLSPSTSGLVTAKSATGVSIASKSGLRWSRTGSPPRPPSRTRPGKVRWAGDLLNRAASGGNCSALPLRTGSARARCRTQARGSPPVLDADIVLAPAGRRSTVPTLTGMPGRASAPNHAGRTCSGNPGRASAGARPEPQQRSPDASTVIISSRSGPSRSRSAIRTTRSPARK